MKVGEEQLHEGRYVLSDLRAENAREVSDKADRETTQLLLFGVSVAFFFISKTEKQKRLDDSQGGAARQRELAQRQACTG